MSKGTFKTRENGDRVKVYKRERVSLTPEVDEAVGDEQLQRLMAEGPADACEEWPDDELKQA